MQMCNDDCIKQINHMMKLEIQGRHLERRSRAVTRKRKYGQGKYNSGAQQNPRFTPNSGGHFQHTHGGGSSHNHSGPKNGNGNGGSNGQNRTNPSTPAKRDLSHITCYKCQKTGHYATEYPEAKNRNDNGSSGKKPNPFNKG